MVGLIKVLSQITSLWGFSFVMCFVLNMQSFWPHNYLQSSWKQSRHGPSGTVRLKENVYQCCEGKNESLELASSGIETLAQGCVGEARHLTISQHCHLWDGSSEGGLYSRLSSRNFYVGIYSVLPYLTMLLGNLLHGPFK